jgi:hypothetical protein
VRAHHTLGLLAALAALLVGCSPVPEGAAGAEPLVCPPGTEGCDSIRPVGPGGDLTIDMGSFFFEVVDGIAVTGEVRVTAINVATIAQLAAAPAAPAGVSVAGELTRDTTVAWQPVSGAARYKIHWRRTDKPAWTDAREVSGATQQVLKEVSVDDHYFGVSAIGPNGAESIVTFAGRAPRR